MTDISADVVMELVEAMECCVLEPSDWALCPIESRFMLDHLTQLHKLRDEKFAEEVNWGLCPMPSQWRDEGAWEAHDRHQEMI